MKYLKRTSRPLFFFMTMVLLAQLAVQFRSVQASPAGEDRREGLAYSTEWRITGPSGGDVRALVVDPNEPSRFYFGTLDGQIYTSTDAGRNWRLLVNLNRPRLFVDHIIVDPRNSKVLYVATHRHKEAGGFLNPSMAASLGESPPNSATRRCIH